MQMMLAIASVTTGPAVRVVRDILARAALLMTAPVALRMTVQEVLVTRALAVLAIQEANSSSAVSTIILDSEERLNQAERNPDAGSFGCLAAGEWWPK
jgi:hypothetical protein